MKQNIKNINNKAKKQANLLCTNGTNHYYNDQEADYFVSHANKDELFGLKTTTKMKRTVNKDAKLGDKYLKHLTLKSIRISFANLFKPSKRIGRNQFDTKQVSQTPNPSRGSVAELNFAASAKVVSFAQSQFQAIDPCFDSDVRNLKRQLNECPVRSMTVTNIYAYNKMKHDMDTNQICQNTERKIQPKMGVKAISAKTGTKFNIKPAENRELIPFLDSIELIPLPISSSTFIAPNRDSIESMQSQFSTGSTCSSQISSNIISPVSIKASRKKCIQLRSISVMNVSSIFADGNQF